MKKKLLIITILLITYFNLFSTSLDKNLTKLKTLINDDNNYEVFLNEYLDFKVFYDELTRKIEDNLENEILFEFINNYIKEKKCEIIISNNKSYLRYKFISLLLYIKGALSLKSNKKYGIEVLYLSYFILEKYIAKNEPAELFYSLWNRAEANFSNLIESLYIYNSPIKNERILSHFIFDDFFQSRFFHIFEISKHEKYTYKSLENQINIKIEIILGNLIKNIDNLDFLNAIKSGLVILENNDSYYNKEQAKEFMDLLNEKLNTKLQVIEDIGIQEISLGIKYDDKLFKDLLKKHILDL